MSALVERDVPPSRGEQPDGWQPRFGDAGEPVEEEDGLITFAPRQHAEPARAKFE